MAPRKTSTAAPMRRSARLASKEPSVPSEEVQTTHTSTAKGKTTDAFIGKTKDAMSQTDHPAEEPETALEPTQEVVKEIVTVPAVSVRVEKHPSGVNDYHSIIRKLYTGKTIQLTSEEVSGVMTTLIHSEMDLKERVKELEEIDQAQRLRDEAIAKRANHFRLLAIKEKYAEKKAEQTQPLQELATTQEPKAPKSPDATVTRDASSLTTPRRDLAPEHPAELPAAAATAITTMTPPTEEQSQAPTTTLGRLFSYIGVPFTRKRSAQEATTPVQSAPKRVRLTEPTPQAREVPTDHSGSSSSAQQTVSSGDAAAPSTVTPRPSQKRKRTEDDHSTPRDAQHTQQVGEPASLSTITERSEPPPPFGVLDTPLPKRTPLRRLREKNFPSSVQRHLPVAYAWEKGAATPKPRETNADTRLAKMQRLQDLQNEMQELKKDADVQELQSHTIRARKRVKVDDLRYIPHNRPGDSSSTFRVPDIDSDDEMEVDEDCSVLDNIFEKEKEKAEPEPPKKKMELSPVRVEQPKYEFPSVSDGPADFPVSEAYKEEAGRLFAEGLADYLATR